MAASPLSSPRNKQEQALTTGAGDHNSGEIAGRAVHSDGKHAHADFMSEQIRALHIYLDQVEEHNHFSGSVMVLHEDHELLKQGYGMSSAEIEGGSQTVFHVGSVTKQFTAAAIMLLQEENSLQVSDPINEYLKQLLPEKFDCDAWASVTIHHLLSHTGGIADYKIEKNSSGASQGFLFGDEVTQAIRDSQSRGLDFDPGSTMQYSNLGYTLLGLIIEQTSGIPYEEFIQTRLLNPLDMSSSGIHTEGYVASADHVKGHKWDEAQKKHVHDDSDELAVTAADGGLFSTTRDLRKWSEMIADETGGPLRQESIDAMKTSTGGYGYGLYVDSAYGSNRVHHGGGIPGFRSYFTLYSEKKIHISLLSNSTHANLQAITKGIEEILFLPNPSL